MTRKCNDCKLEKDPKEFWKQTSHKDGLRTQCKVCLSKKAKRYNEKNKTQINAKRVENNKKPLQYFKKKARRDLGNAIRDGKIRKRNSCEICYNSPTECHHEDYDKPFDFIELCKRCHSKLHKLYA